MDLVTIAIVGLIATGYMSLLHWLVERHGVVKGNLMQTIGSFLIPEPIRSPITALFLHFLTGIAFAAAYAFVFDFVNLRGLGSYLALGGLIGLVHGVFISYFTMLGFSGYVRAERVQPLSGAAVILHVLSHVMFGAIIGLGLAYRSLTGTIFWFALYGVLGLVALGGLASLVSAPSKKLPHRGRGLPRASGR